MNAAPGRRVARGRPSCCVRFGSLDPCLELKAQSPAIAVFVRHAQLELDSVDLLSSLATPVATVGTAP